MTLHHTWQVPFSSTLGSVRCATVGGQSLFFCGWPVPREAWHWAMSIVSVTTRMYLTPKLNCGSFRNFRKVDGLRALMFCSAWYLHFSMHTSGEEFRTSPTKPQMSLSCELQPSWMENIHEKPQMSAIADKIKLNSICD